MNIRISHWLPMIVSIIWVACQQNEEMDSRYKDEGKFFASVAYDYTLDITTTKNNQDNTSTSKGELASMTIAEEDWGIPTELSTRTTVSGDDLSWIDKPLLSMYITDATTDILLKGDVPLNAVTLSVYDQYDVAGNGTAEAITGSRFFWETWSNKSLMTDKVNFYGYYPRPCDERDWQYRRNSIIKKEDARNTEDNWYQLGYDFQVNQTDDNLSEFDLMYSVPEEANANDSHRHGNKDKSKDNNIQMAFKHAFCLLDIEIYRGTDYKGNCLISSLSISGNQAFTKGVLDIKEGKITPSDANVINRTITAQNITTNAPFKTTMIVQPTTDNPTTDVTGQTRLTMSCTIDGAEYSCPFPQLKLQGGKKYNIKLTVTPSGAVVFRVWNGATVNVADYTLNAGEESLSVKASEFSVSPESGYRILRVLKNGEKIEPEENGNYLLEQQEGVNMYYNVVTCPDKEWYQDPDLIRILFDAKWNDKYKDKDVLTPGILSWSDLTGNNNDGTLQSFNMTNESGWGTDCLIFDGIDDIVKFPGNISSEDFTVETFIYVYAEQVTGKVYGRIFAEDENTGYPSLCLKSAKAEEGKGNISICGNGSIYHNLPNETNVLGKTVQIDYVFTASDKKIKLYLNGASDQTWERTAKRESTNIPEASLGNRTADNTRALKAKYYNYLLYDKKLSDEEIKENYKLNLVRFAQESE